MNCTSALPAATEVASPPAVPQTPLASETTDLHEVSRSVCFLHPLMPRLGCRSGRLCSSCCRLHLSNLSHERIQGIHLKKERKKKAGGCGHTQGGQQHWAHCGGGGALVCMLNPAMKCTRTCRPAHLVVIVGGCSCASLLPCRSRRPRQVRPLGGPGVGLALPCPRYLQMRRMRYSIRPLQ